MPEWVAELVLSPTYEPAPRSLEELSLSFFRMSNIGIPRIWHVKARPITRAQLEEWYATGSLNGEPFPTTIQSKAGSGAV